jgi:hypothetical protein
MRLTDLLFPSACIDPKDGHKRIVDLYDLTSSHDLEASLRDDYI